MVGYHFLLRDSGLYGIIFTNVYIYYFGFPVVFGWQFICLHTSLENWMMVHVLLRVFSLNITLFALIQFYIYSRLG
jgi:hypothetical protein